MPVPPVSGFQGFTSASQATPLSPSISFSAAASTCALVERSLRTLTASSALSNQNSARPSNRGGKDRKRVVEGKSVAGRVDLGGRRTIQKTHEIIVKQKAKKQKR